MLAINLPGDSPADSYPATRSASGDRPTRPQRPATVRPPRHSQRSAGSRTAARRQNSASFHVGRYELLPPGVNTSPGVTGSESTMTMLCGHG